MRKKVARKTERERKKNQRRKEHRQQKQDAEYEKELTPDDMRNRIAAMQEMMEEMNKIDMTKLTKEEVVTANKAKCQTLMAMAHSEAMLMMMTTAANSYTHLVSANK